MWMRAFILFAVGLWLTPAFGQSPARQALDRKITEYRGANEGMLLEVTHPAIAAALPQNSFFVLRFRRFPVAQVPEPPLESNNLFVVKPDQSVQLITRSEDLRAFFTGALRRIESGQQAETVATAWLRLLQELHQDGFYQFNEPGVSRAVVSRDQPPGHIQTTGNVSVVPTGGNKGQIATTMVFDNGKLASVTDKVELLAGIRPLCQATKLLDPDPIVRGMAVQSILVMGQSARAYLDEQRKLASPDLQREIDRLWKKILDEGR